MDAASLYPMNINWRYYELEAFFAACAEHGFSSAELWLCPQHFLINAQYSEDPARLQALMGEYGVKLTCICGEQNNPKPNNIAARGELLIANTRAYFERVIDLAALVGSPLVLVTPGWNYYDEPVEDARTRSASMLAHLADYAAPRGITLALESIWTVSSQVTPTIADIAALKDRVNRENLKLTLDFGAMGNAGETIGQWFDAFGRDLVHCHFIDGTPTGHMPWGHGARDMAADLAVFAANDYAGGFSMEYVHPMSFRDPAIYMEETKVLFEKCLGEITRAESAR